MTIRYGFFGEDSGQRIFLEQYLVQLTQNKTVSFEQAQYFSKQFGFINNKVVDRRCGDACKQAFLLEKTTLDCLFIGRDVDSYKITDYQKRLTDLQVSIQPRWQHKAILLLPVQCIEHWLLYLHRLASGIPINKIRELETVPKDSAKDELYKFPRQPATQSKDEFVAVLASNLDINWLCERSNSFNRFHQQVNTFLAYLPATP
ncbi:MAG: hypothetical protein EOO61_07090 [Hymenobacter sp.]|nr:MAG: hypothetical protein EOO61_07090 [Hymenobacter sp.]